MKYAGCLFHFGQSLIRNVQRLGLMPLYEVQDSPLKKWVHLIKALAFLPVDLVLDAWNFWLTRGPDGYNAQERAQIIPFIEYFEVVH